MNKFFTFLLLGIIALNASAQTIPSAQPFGKVDIADLEMKACDFEKDANAEVLFNKGVVFYAPDLSTITEEVHKRIKIFNNNGKGEADIHIEFYGGYHLEYITGVQAQTINLVDGKVEITKLDRKLIYTKTIDKVRNEIAFTLPNVKPGSIIEYKYTWTTNAYYNFPAWYFQDILPVRYSELNTEIPDILYFRTTSRTYTPLVKFTQSSEGRSTGNGPYAAAYNVDKSQRAMANIHSLVYEPYMSSFRDNVQCLLFQLTSVRPIVGYVRNYSDTWAKAGGTLAEDENFGSQLKRKLNNEEAIISKAKAMPMDERIAYIFNEVKNAMKWNDIDSWYTNDGTYRAWENKTGNSAEINLILYHLLMRSDVDAYPMVVSTREHGRVAAYYPSLNQFNRAVVYVPVDSTKNYVLDATGKYNQYNETPAELLNSSGLYIDKSKGVFNLIYLKKDLPVIQMVLINAEIKPNGTLDGNAEINNNSYHKINATQKYKTDGEKKYLEYLQDGDNNLKISALKMENIGVDTLPLIQRINFNLELAGSDENYIYLNPNLFTPLKSNPLLSEKRMTNIDFGYLQNYLINGIYKIPAGYKTDALPKNVTIVMPDKSITFKRFVGEQDGSIIVRYNINYNQTEYLKDEYPDIYVFYKKMYEMLNEQIVLKKAQ